MKAINIYKELRTKGFDDWDILDIVESEYYNQNFNSELLEDFPIPSEYLMGDKNIKDNFNWELGLEDEQKRIFAYMESIDFDFNDTTAEGY